MPMKFKAHAVDCPQKSKCGCEGGEHTEYQKALEAVGGDSARVEIVQITPPKFHLPPPIRPEQSQARRHTRSISD